MWTTPFCGAHICQVSTPTSAHVYFTGSLDGVKCKCWLLSQAEPSQTLLALQALQQIIKTLFPLGKVCHADEGLTSQHPSVKHKSFRWGCGSHLGQWPLGWTHVLLPCYIAQLVSRLTDQLLVMRWLASIVFVVCHRGDEPWRCPQITEEVCPQDCRDWTVCIIHLKS